MDAFTATIAIVHLGSTWFMVGLIWFVQIVHYPLFGHVPTTAFADYERRHQTLTTRIVGPAMLIEGFSAALLVAYRLDWSSFIGMGLLVLIWLSTALIQVPFHTQLAHEFNPLIHRRLVLSNWLRTIAWSTRGVLASMPFIAERL
jgi:hypothetical protein